MKVAVGGVCGGQYSSVSTPAGERQMSKSDTKAQFPATDRCLPLAKHFSPDKLSRPPHISDRVMYA